MDGLEEEYDYGRYPRYVGRVVEYGPEGQEQAGHCTGGGRVRKPANGLFGALHSTALSGSSIQFLVIFSLPGIKEEFELVDGEFATKVALKDGRKSKVAVARKVEVLAIIDARGAGEKPFSNGIWMYNPKSLSPDWAILGNVIRAKRGSQSWGEVLWLHGGSRRGKRNAPPLRGHVRRWGHTLSELRRERRVSAISRGRWAT